MIQNPGALLQFTELISAPSAQAGDNTWQDWDISTLVSGKPLYVIIHIVAQALMGTTRTAGVRKAGSALDRIVTISAIENDIADTAKAGVTMTVNYGTGIIQRKSSDHNTIFFSVIGQLE